MNMIEFDIYFPKLRQLSRFCSLRSCKFVVNFPLLYLCLSIYKVQGVRMTQKKSAVFDKHFGRVIVRSQISV